MGYFQASGSDSIILIAGISIIIILIFISIMTINKKCNDKKIKHVFYIALFFQIIILIIDNYIKPFPTLEWDPRAFEMLGWISYLENISIGRGAYNLYFINPIYKFLGIRIALIFGALNIFFHILINLNLYYILKKIIKNLKNRRRLLYISILSPMSLIIRAGILREAIMILLLSYSLKYFIEAFLNKQREKIFLIISFLFLGLSSVFHSGIIFMGSGYIYYLLKNKKSKFLNLIIFSIIGVSLIIFKDSLLGKFGNIDTEQIIQQQNYVSLKSGGSAYLIDTNIDSLETTLLYLPVRIFYFLYSPTPDLIRNIMDLGVFLLNSMIYIYLTIIGYKNYRKLKNKINLQEINIIKALGISIILTIVVFSIGTQNAGTAVRHRDKIIIFIIVLFGILQDKIENKRKGNKIVRKNI